LQLDKSNLTFTSSLIFVAFVSRRPGMRCNRLTCKQIAI
jgi:hypothetical protein